MDNRITEFTEDVEVIQKLGDYPNTDDSMSADELKAQFDRAPSAIKRFLNEQVVPALIALQNSVSFIDEDNNITANEVRGTSFDFYRNGKLLAYVDAEGGHNGVPVLVFYAESNDGPVRLCQIADPHGARDAANKKYVDESIKAILENDGGTGSAVLYTEQNLTEAQQAQARENIGVITDPDIHAEYFTITDDGVVSLRPEYRGASNKDNLAYSVSDMGIGVVGSKNSELPKYLVIPEVVNDRAVYSLADGIFNENEMLESVVLPDTVDKIPLSCFNLCSNLKNVFNTENIKSVGQTAFQRTSVKRLKFPMLEQFGGAGAFMCCGDLVYIDVGNVTDLPLYTFAFCINLNMIKSKNAIKSVGQLSLPLTANLKHAEFIQNLTSIGASAFLASGVDYDWGTLTNCTFGDDATPLQYNPTDYWSACTYTACTNPTPTMLSQDDPRWINRQIGTTDFKYDNGCTLMCIMHAYCGLHNLHLSTVMEFEEMITSIYPECLNNFTNAYNEVDTVCRSFGLSATAYTNIDKTVLQTLYNALAEGKYALVNFHGKTTTLGHCALAYGIDANGNLLLLDSETYHAYDKSIPSTYSLPWHKLSAGNFYGVENLVIISL